MATIDRMPTDEGSKRRILYAAMVVVGVGFVTTPVLPIPIGTAQVLAALLFGIMSGLWLGLLVWSL